MLAPVNLSVDDAGEVLGRYLLQWCCNLTAHTDPSVVGVNPPWSVEFFL
jgi:hypothetical protein